MSFTELSEQEIIRRNSLNELAKLGIEAYPAPEFQVNAHAAEIKERFDETAEPRNVVIAGRMMSRRIMGKASFFELQDATGRIQVYVSRDDISTDEASTAYNTVFKKLMDIGDIVGVKGFVFRTQTGDIFRTRQRIDHVVEIVAAAADCEREGRQGVRAFTDPEQRYRQRYLDLIVNPQVKEVFVKRTRMINAIRNFFNSKGYLEVETPVLQAIPGGASARPFITHHNALVPFVFAYCQRIIPETADCRRF